MIANGNGNNAERLGRFLGRLWLLFIQREIVLARSLANLGMRTPVAHASVWIVTLLALVLAVHFVIAGAVVVLALWILSGVLSSSEIDATVTDEEPKLRQGLLGFGLYDRHDIRVDPYDPDDLL